MPRRYLDPVLIGGAFVSVFAGLVSYFGGERDIVLSVAVGFQALTISLVLDMILRFERQREYIGKSGELVTKIESITWLPELLGRYADEITSIELKYAMINLT